MSSYRNQTGSLALVFNHIGFFQSLFLQNRLSCNKHKRKGRGKVKSEIFKQRCVPYRLEGSCGFSFLVGAQYCFLGVNVLSFFGNIEFKGLVQVWYRKALFSCSYVPYKGYWAMSLQPLKASSFYRYFVHNYTFFQILVVTIHIF